MLRRLAMLVLWACTLTTTGGVSLAAKTPAASPAAGAVPSAADATAQYDVFANVLSEPQRKSLDRDARCHDARSATDAFVASDGKALQTGVDAMAALEKCAGLPRVGADWVDYRDYAITAAAALAYAVGVAANDERLLRRAVDDASHVRGYEASNATVQILKLNTNENPLSEQSGHHMGEGPPQSDRRYVGESKVFAADSRAYGKLATAIARASNSSLQALAAESNTRPQAHATPSGP